MRVASSIAPAERALKSTWLLGTLVGLCSWSLLASIPVYTIDSSWILGLQMSLARGLHFGPEVLFSYGPLGFLGVPLAAFSPYAELGGLYTLGVRLALGLTLVWAARRAFGIWLGAPIALIAALLLTFAPVVAVALTWSLVALGPDSPDRVRRLFPLIAAPVAAIEMLNKLSIGPVILVICAITVIAMDGRRLRNVLTFAGAFIVTLAAFWFALGQGISNIGPYAQGAFEIVSGYSSAMAAHDPNRNESARIAATIGIALAGLAAGYLATRRLPALRRVAVVSILLFTSFAVWKMAFVRFGLPAMPYLFAAALPAWLAFPWTQIELPRPTGRIPAPALAMAGFAAIVVLYFPMTQAPLSTLDPVERLRTEVDQLPRLVLPGRLAETRREAQAALVQHFRLDPRTRTLLRGQTVNVDQTDIAIAWAYDLDWRPLPAFQAYAAYTPYLDRQNRASLLAADGPSRILRVSSIPSAAIRQLSPAEAQPYNLLSNTEGTLRAWNQPATTLAMLCNFKPLSTTLAYQVLARGRNRCGTPRRLHSLSAGYGEEIPVPAPPGRNELVFADIDGMAPAGWERLRTAFYRASIYRVTVNRGPQYTVKPTVTHSLVLRSSAGTDFPTPFALAPQATTISFEKEGAEPSSTGLRITFYALRLRPTGGGAVRGPRQSAATHG